ncbi:septum site-determining protein Ssd [Rhodococcus kronopolitis]|uniref:Septum site-determining protein Ssd n=1 Tax=Rhodococcus kronopolitis TaxID=1460226 RepID=A0ABV9FVC6_9NOCA
MDASRPLNDRRVLVVTDDADLSPSIRRAAAAADREVGEHAPPVPRQRWDGASQVLLDAASAMACAAAGLPRRPGLVVLCAAEAGLAQWRAAAAVGAETVLTLPAEEPELVALLSRRSEQAVPGGAVVAMMGGRGGAGASVLAAATALTAPRHRPDRRVLLVDCDSRGGGLDLLLGVEQRPGLRWSGVAIEGGRVSAAALHDALPRAGSSVAVLSCGRGAMSVAPRPAAVAAVIESGRGAGELVVCDVPRTSDATVAGVLDLADLVIVVVPAQVRAAAAAESLAVALRGAHPNVGVVVRGPSPGGLRGGEVAELLGLPLIASMRPEPGLATTLDHGGLRLRRGSPLAAAATAILDVLEVGGAGRAS